MEISEKILKDLKKSVMFNLSLYLTGSIPVAYVPLDCAKFVYNLLCEIRKKGKFFIYIIMAKRIAYYNSQQRHEVIRYLMPADVIFGKAPCRPRCLI